MGKFFEFLRIGSLNTLSHLAASHRPHLNMCEEILGLWVLIKMESWVRFSGCL